jgi:hypothetical protein
MVLALALLAGLKIWVQDTLYRSATEDAVIAAYRERAIAACQREPQKDAQGHSLAPSIVTWATPASVKLVIGNSSVGVHIWEIDHQLWNARYKHAYLMLSPGDRRAGFACAYNIALGAAQLNRI